MRKLIILLVLITLLLITVPAFAAGGFDFTKGAFNLLTLAKVIVGIAVVIAFIAELFGKRNIAYIFAIIIIAGIVVYIVEPGKGRMAEFGHEVLMYIGGGTGTQEVTTPDKLVETEQKPTVLNNSSVQQPIQTIKP